MCDDVEVLFIPCEGEVRRFTARGRRDLLCRGAGNNVPFLFALPPRSSRGWGKVQIATTPYASLRRTGRNEARKMFEVQRKLIFISARIPFSPFSPFPILATARSQFANLL
jgi:hypothetical protein